MAVVFLFSYNGYALQGLFGKIHISFKDRECLERPDRIKDKKIEKEKKS